MNLHVRAVSYSWAAVGLTLAAWALWGLVVGRNYTFVLKSFFIVLGFAVLAMTAGLTFGGGATLGRALVRLVSLLAVLYSGAWLFLGGLDDAPGYWPGIVAAVGLAIYSFVVAGRTRAA